MRVAICTENVTNIERTKKKYVQKIYFDDAFVDGANNPQ